MTALQSSKPEEQAPWGGARMGGGTGELAELLEALCVLTRMMSRVYTHKLVELCAWYQYT